MNDRKASDSFLNRWSSRKQQSARQLVNDDAAQETLPESVLPDPADSSVMSPEGLLQSELHGNDLQPVDTTGKDGATCVNTAVLRSDERAPVEQALLTDADMPAIESLTASSDISGFLGKGVSAALRKAALRHVFRQPKYNVRDGLDDYDDDYTTFEPLGDTVTSDMKFHAARKERARLASERLADEPAQTELDTQAQADTAQDSTSTIDQEHTGKPVEEESEAGREDRLDDDQQRHENTVAMAEDNVAEEVNLSRTLQPDHRPDTGKPLNKTSQAVASPHNEIENE